MLFVKFVVEFIDFGPYLIQRLPARGGDRVDAPAASADPVEAGFEQAGALHSMKERIEGAGPNPVTVMLQLSHHSQPEDGLVRGMDEHVDANEPVVEFPLVIPHTIEYNLDASILACLLSKFDI